MQSASGARICTPEAIRSRFRSVRQKNRPRGLLDLSISTDRDCAETRDIALAQLNEVGQKPELRALEHRLEISSRAARLPVLAARTGLPVFNDLAMPAKGKSCG